jgi:hypothetical protein
LGPGKGAEKELPSRISRGGHALLHAIVIHKMAGGIGHRDRWHFTGLHLALNADSIRWGLVIVAVATA